MAHAYIWPYRFVSLTPAQIQERREVLDARGTVVQISALLLLASVTLYWRVGKPSSRSRATLKGGYEQGSLKRSWWDSPPVHGWRETRRQYLLTLGWVAWLVGLSAWRTGDGRCLLDCFSSVSRLPGGWMALILVEFHACLFMCSTCVIRATAVRYQYII